MDQTTNRNRKREAPTERKVDGRTREQLVRELGLDELLNRQGCIRDLFGDFLDDPLEPSDEEPIARVFQAGSPRRT